MVAQLTRNMILACAVTMASQYIGNVDAAPVSSPVMEQSDAVMPQLLHPGTEPSIDARLLLEIATLANVVNKGPRVQQPDLSYVAYDRINKGLATLNDNLQYYPAGLQGKLELVWGPAFVMSDDKDVPTEVDGDYDLSYLLWLSHTKTVPPWPRMNVMYVARDPDTATYYVGIGGTVADSILTWLVENFNVATLNLSEPWSGVDNGAHLFRGTSLGLHFLQTITPLANLPGAGQTVMDFFQMTTSSSAINAVRVSGHSLGGTLTPVFALWLQDFVLPGATVTVDIFAGASPGNAAFAEYYNSRPVAQHTRVTSNYLDIVPHAWAADTLAQVPSLYASVLPQEGSAECIQGLLDFVNKNILISDVGVAARINPNADQWFEIGWRPTTTTTTTASLLTPEPQQQGLRRQAGPSMEDIIFSFIYPDDQYEQQACRAPVHAFGDQALWQHTDAYRLYLDPLVAKLA